jgi:hypothetical protein
MQPKSNVVLKTIDKKNNLFAISLDKKKKDLELFLPNNWWSSTNSLNYFSEESPKVFQLLEFEKKHNIDFCNIKYDLPKPKNWNIKNGGYHVKENNYNKRDFLYYRELKAKIYKYSLYPVIVLTLLLTYFASSILVKM